MNQARAIFVFALAVLFVACRWEYDPKGDEHRARHARVTAPPKPSPSSSAPTAPEPLSSSTEADFEQQAIQLITTKNLEAEVARLEQEISKEK